MIYFRNTNHRKTYSNLVHICPNISLPNTACKSAELSTEVEHQTLRQTVYINSHTNAHQPEYSYY